MRQNTGWVIALTGIGSLMAALDTLVVSTALSTIRVDLGGAAAGLALPGRRRTRPALGPPSPHSNANRKLAQEVVQ